MLPTLTLVCTTPCGGSVLFPRPHAPLSCPSLDPHRCLRRYFPAVTVAVASGGVVVAAVAVVVGDVASGAAAAVGTGTGTAMAATAGADALTCLGIVVFWVCPHSHQQICLRGK